MIKEIVIAGIIFSSFNLLAQKQFAYKKPPKEIMELLEAPTTPGIKLDPKGEWLLQLGDPGFKTIADLAHNELKLAGIRFHPDLNSRSRISYSDSLVLTNIKSGKDFEVQGLPEVSKLGNFNWSPNGKYIAFTHLNTSGLELWVLDIEKKKANKLTEPIVSAVMPQNPIVWMDNGEWMLVNTVVKDKAPLTEKSNIPFGPMVRESRGEKAAVRTYQDLLETEYDEQLFDYYATSQLVKVNVNSDQFPIGDPAIFKEISVSPDARFLLVKMIQRPYSYSVPYYRFPLKVEIWDNDGNLFRELFNIPLADNIPKGFAAVRKGPREINWRSDKPASLYWVVALDEGDPEKQVLLRDRLVLFDFPFDGKGKGSVAFEKRFGGVNWGKSDFAICSEWWWNTRTETVSSFNPEGTKESKKLIFEYNWQDEYNSPGDFVTSQNEEGHQILQFDEKQQNIYLKGRGATPDGYKPFVDKYNIESGEKVRMWQSNDPYYEYPYAFVDAKKEIVLTRRESKIDPPNFFSRNLKNGVVSQITNFSNPYPQLVDMRKELIKYSRKDSLQLSGTLYTPPGFTVGDGMLPVILWAYPNEFKSAATAGQIKESPNKFVRLGWWSPIFWVLRGYAILDNPAMPIVGEGDSEPNDSFIEQLVADAEAAIYCLDSLGIADINKVAIGGHSYGAFMAANLLAHSDLFAAGIARSGAFNRTLTPFGFQAEQRTFWEASDTYVEMSPFTYAHKINEPLLLIHGEADNNSGTYPLQSERMYAAIKGNGGNSRLVMLPLESHGYQAKESILHMLWEMDAWLEKYVKQIEK